MYKYETVGEFITVQLQWFLLGLSTSVSVFCLKADKEGGDTIESGALLQYFTTSTESA